MRKFNLLDEQWIQCVTLSGEFQEVGIREIIENAHMFKRLTSSIPLVNASILLLLETLIIRVLYLNGFACNDYDTWNEGFQANHFSEDWFEQYFQQWHDYFYLVDDTFPFFQDIIKGESYTGTAMKLMPHFSGGTGGNSPTLFDHHTIDDGIALTLQQAARFLLPAHYYGAGGRIIGSDYFSDSPIASGLAFFINGETLFETLFLNLLPYPEIEGIATKPDDIPIWEQRHEEPVRTVIIENGKQLVQPLGLIDALTWKGRKIQLLLDDDDKVRQIKMRSGLKMIDQKFPWFAYNQKGNYLRARQEHAAWRDFTTLLQFRDYISGEDAYRSPLPIQWLHELVREEYMQKKFFSVLGLGMAKEAGKQNVFFYTEQSLPLPAQYLCTHSLVLSLSGALTFADEISKNLYWAISDFAETILSFNIDHTDGRKPDPNDKKRLIEHLGSDRLYWGSLEPHFSILIHQLPVENEVAMRNWKTAIRGSARDALEHAIRMAGESVHVMKASVSARSILESAIRKILLIEEKEPMYD